MIFCAHLVAVKCEVFITTSTRKTQLCARPATQLTRCPHTSGKSIPMREDLSERGLPSVPVPNKRVDVKHHVYLRTKLNEHQRLCTPSVWHVHRYRLSRLRALLSGTSFVNQCLEFASVHLDFRACAMDWRVKSAGSRGEHVSWVAGQAYSCISLVLVVVKTSPSTPLCSATVLSTGCTPHPSVATFVATPGIMLTSPPSGTG